MEFLRKMRDRLMRPSRKPDSLTIPVHHLIASSERMKQRGLTKPASMVGHVVSRARRQAKLSVEQLAVQSGHSVEDIIDLNLGALPLQQAASMVEQLKKL